jgi:hypothetical protein
MYRLIGSRPWCARCAGRHDRRGPTITDPDRDAAGGLPLWPSGAGNGAETPHTGQSPALARRNALRRPSSALLTAGRQVPRPCERRPRTVRPARGIPARQDHHSCCFLRRRTAQDVFGSGQPDGTAISANSLSSDAQGFEPYDPPCSSWKPVPPRRRADMITAALGFSRTPSLPVFQRGRPEVTLENPKPEPIIGLAAVTARRKSTPSGGERSLVVLKRCRSGEGACLPTSGRRIWSVAFVHDDVPA